MTGTDKAIGDRARQGIRIAVEEANDEQNLILGRKLAVRHADARSDGRYAEAEAVRLASVNHVVALVGGTDTAQAEQLARGAEAAGVPVVLQAALPTASAGGNVFSCVPSLARRGTVLGKFVAEQKVGKVAVIADERSRAAGPIAEAFAGALPKDSAQRFHYKIADEFAAVIGQAASAKPDAVLLLGSARDLPRFRAELQKALPGVRILFGGDESSLPALLADRTAGESIYLATCYQASDESAANQKFTKEYREHFHELPDVNAALAYDGTRLLGEAIRKANVLNPAKVREVLPELANFESVTGPFTFGKDHHARRPLFIVQIQNGQAVLQKRYGSEE